jgi:hypothetical protein
MHKNLIWLASYPKSGNTWVRIFLQHILGTGDPWSGIPDLCEIPIASNRRLIDQHLGMNSSDLTADEITDCRPAVYRALASGISGPQVLKVHDAFAMTSGGDPVFPPEVTRAAIYVVRNPLDVVISYAFHSGKSFQSIIDQLNDPMFTLSGMGDELKAQVPQYLGTWSEHVVSWTRQTYFPVIQVKYEDLLAGARQVFRTTLAQLAITFTDMQLEEALRASDFDHLKRMEELHGFREKPMQAASFFREGRQGSFKKYLSDRQIEKVVSVHGKIMATLGYQTSLQ